MSSRTPQEVLGLGVARGWLVLGTTTLVNP